MTADSGPDLHPDHDHDLALLRCDASNVSTELRRLPRRQVDTLHPDVRNLVLQFQLSLGATKQGSPVPQRSPTKKVQLLPHARPPPPLSYTSLLLITTPHCPSLLNLSLRPPLPTTLRTLEFIQANPTLRPWYTLTSSRHRAL